MRTTSQRCGWNLPAGAVVRGVLCVLALVVWTTPTRADDRSPPPPAAAPGADSADETWQVISIGEQRIGYSHSTIRPVQRAGRKVIRTRNETKMQIRRFGQTLKIETLLETEETAEGELLSFTMEMKNPPAGTSRSVGRVEGDKLVLEKTDAGRTTTRTTPFDRDLKSPVWQERSLRENPLRPGESRSFKIFSPEFNTVATVRIVADAARLTKLHDGESRQLLKVAITQSVLPGITIRGWLDDQGEALKTEMDFLGQSMTTYTVPAQVALQQIADGGELDLAISTLVRVDRIRDAHQAKRAVYRITIPGEDPARIVVTGPAQQVQRIDDSTVELTVTAIPIPDSVPAGPAARAGRPDPEYLAATEYLQSGDRRVIDHARRAAAGDTNPVDVARRMERYVHEQLRKKDFSTALATAAEVAENLQGDCTEHAVLLAAMLRAYKVPSRIAVGLVYVEGLSAFGGHMWTEALLGDTWVPLDATLGLGGTGAAHIKLADSSFSDDGPAPVTAFLPLLTILGQMQIEVVEPR